MSTMTLSTQFGFTYYTLQTNLKDIDHADSVFQPANGSNCMNWVLGHIMTGRNGALKLLGLEPLWSNEDSAPYERGSTPITADGPQVMKLDKLLADLKAAQDKILERVPTLTPAELSEPAPGVVDGGTLEQQLAALAFHEAYHAGQLGVLRHAVGKVGVIT